MKTEEDIPKVATLGRLEVNDRLRDIPAVIRYNILQKKIIVTYSNGNPTQALVK